MRDEEEDSKPVIDPYTCKILRINNEIVESDLREILGQFGEVVRAKIPMDEERGTNRGIGFVTFRDKEACTAVCELGFIKFDVFEFVVDRATQSANRQ